MRIFDKRNLLNLYGKYGPKKTQKKKSNDRSKTLINLETYYKTMINKTVQVKNRSTVTVYILCVCVMYIYINLTI